MEYALGVDLGTTHIAAAVNVDGRIEVVQLGDRHKEMPALIYLAEDGRTMVGDGAERNGRGDPSRLVREVKRRMGDPVSILVGGAPFSAHALLGRLLKHVVETVTALYDGPPAHIVVTHPANWGPYKREQLDQVFETAGLTGVETLTEPEAAAIHHAAGKRIAPGELIAVYDLGGGTFDAAVLRRTETGYQMPGPPSGIEQLGGMDFDEAVFGHVTRVLGAEVAGGGDADFAASVTRLRRDCVEGKESLSFDTEVQIPVALPGFHTRVRMTRAEFEALITPALGDTVEALGRAIRGAGVTADDISMVLLSGGSSRIPLVTQVITAGYARPVAQDPHPEHSIAMGAALVAGQSLLSLSAPTFDAPVGDATIALPPPLPKATVRATVPSPDSTQEFALTGPAPSDAELRRRQRIALIAAIVIVLIGAIGGVALALQGRDDIRPAGTSSPVTTGR
ncbi:Hsp70 family protein [Actinoplanes sp. NBRC 103695]|uniref:Hsp70 family protein n=1 Tax=Actinoplanes sp. NBRC 103695 TaxID=3032202 RepID=UPI00249FF8A3|nr:Hsp70 family protein [Actinoplanes sp. NBRC 103695]GLZ01936.1 molecular chaperone DnaK [Actinoplanes sp. NBRC 103695]